MFKRNNIKLYSKITPLKAGITSDLAHILSFRMQVYVDPEDVKRIPSFFPITLENNTFRIFATTEKQTCFNCNQEGHTANHCLNNVGSNVSIFKINPNPNSSSSSHTDDLPKEAKLETPNTTKLIELAVQGSLNAIKHREIAIEDTNANKTGNKRLTASEESIANPVKPSDIYFKTQNLPKNHTRRLI
ncbi:hypothetical protein QLX08_009225 [Tetragonisca angustula]|uniref:CCHC-type domain-containing protein n=2 Tax=Tetragonisca angustula TaxID=166442 RepID=A0AAW0ZGQ5_9HYME